jgi:tRNA U34 5-methylaminomethyl-2-thiouridine-forming methyltransferase MnmC
MNPLRIITTSDGSHSLLNTELNETYHSIHGACQESLHVFIQRGLQYFAEVNSSKKEINILEVGFGTGLNALLTLDSALSQNFHIRYCALETNPLEEAIWAQLNFASSAESRKNFTALHKACWGIEESIQANFSLLKVMETLQDVKLPHTFDLVYFDAFAPNKQPEMWELPVLRKIVDHLKTDGVFVTYCAKGQLKRDLKNLGLLVQTLAGPPGKKEMTRALKNW